MKETKASKWKKIKKAVHQHIKIKKEIYLAISFFVICMGLISSLIAIKNYFVIEENTDFYKNVKLLTYDELTQDLNNKKIIAYSTNWVYSKHLTYSDIFYDTKIAANIVVYKFDYKNDTFAYYVLDKLKADSLNNKDSKANTSLYNLENKRGKIISLIDFGIGDFISFFGSSFILILIIIGVQLLIGEVVAGKNFTAKSIDTDINFNDIIGYDEVKEQFKEIAKFIKNKRYFEDNELTVPKGILLTGEPGVGKTMFAKAFASEVQASLFFASGADFAELYVGVGAKRIRSLFRAARVSAPSIIFIDEFDAIGSREGMIHDSERLSVINQLLTEMDGLGKKEDIFVIATTNYEKKIDPALLRPGRIDKKIHIPTPDKNTRKNIIKKYLGNYTTTDEYLDIISIRTQGYSGATLRNLVEETKSEMVKRKGINVREITLDDFSSSMENLLLGLKKSLEFNKEQEKRIAFHELGHAIVSLILNPNHNVEKITIEPRGNALGFTMITPTEERFLYTKEELLNQVSILLAGRAAEEVLLGNITNGARDDLDKANKIVNEMIESFGMGDKHPLLVNIDNNKIQFEENKEERAKILLEQYEVSKKLIIKFKPQIESLLEILLEEKTILGDTILQKIEQ